MFNIIYSIFYFLFFYLLGSFPTAYLVTKKFAGKDVRTEESRNVGAMNVMRITGRPLLFLLVAIPIFIKQWPHFVPALKGTRPKWYFKKRKT